MERIDLFDRYFNRELPDEEEKRFKERLETDEDFASDFKAYSLIVAGICREAEQDNVDFGVAMKHLTREQLFDIIGRRSAPVTRDDIIRRLQSRMSDSRSRASNLPADAAFYLPDDDDD